MGEDLTALGPEIVTWMTPREGNRCPLCLSDIEYTGLGMEHGSSGHRIECECTVIECRGKPH